MNTMKKNGGFTLVELIIVIAILAILSTGAIAGYSAYIKNANDKATLSALNEISTSAVLANAETGAIGSIEVVTDGENNIKITVTGNLGDKFQPNFEAALTGDEKGTKGNGSYVITIKAPTAWKNSEYVRDGAKGATWNGSAWAVKQ